MEDCELYDAVQKHLKGIPAYKLYPTLCDTASKDIWCYTSVAMAYLCREPSEVQSLLEYIARDDTDTDEEMGCSITHNKHAVIMALGCSNAPNIEDVLYKYTEIEHAVALTRGWCMKTVSPEYVVGNIISCSLWALSVSKKTEVREKAKLIFLELLDEYPITRSGKIEMNGIQLDLEHLRNAMSTEAGAAMCNLVSGAVLLEHGCDLSPEYALDCLDKIWDQWDSPGRHPNTLIPMPPLLSLP